MYTFSCEVLARSLHTHNSDAIFFTTELKTKILHQRPECAKNINDRSENHIYLKVGCKNKLSIGEDHFRFSAVP